MMKSSLKVSAAIIGAALLVLLPDWLEVNSVEKAATECASE
ncbi:MULTISPECIES: hypothetical protein [Vibrio]|nr:hypothetical protein [Vibrio nereis]